MSPASLDAPVFSVPIRWTLRALAWAAFGVSAYLAWHAVNQTSVAGCGVGAESGCDMVQASTWAKWLGMPVAVLGLACYASLATLSALLGVRNPQSSRWIHTLFVMLAAAAALASIWFLALQVFAIGHYCKYCIVTDLCGIALGALAVGFTFRWLHSTRHVRVSHNSATGLMALRTAMPTATRTSPVVTPSRSLAPSLSIALSGALAIGLLLIGGQLLFREKSYELQQVALTESIDMSARSNDEPREPAPLPAEGRVAMRIPTEPIDNDPDGESEAVGDPDVVGAQFEEPSISGESTSDEPAVEGSADQSESVGELAEATEATDSQPTAVAESPKRERKVTFLDGKLTLDVYEHPLIGSPEAPHVLVEMVSYDCKHCRATHRRIKQALARYGDQVAIIVMAVPLERKCNKLITNPSASHPGACSTARMTLGVAKLKPSAFAKFHDWLMADEEKPPALDRIISRAYGLVDRDSLRELSGGDELNKQIQQYVDLYSKLAQQNSGKKSFGLPIQILGDHIMSGTVEKPADMYEAWEKHLGVKPPGRS
jgi:uncharacterized membrane protein/protein-disulfide isomerase